ncbi:MAG: holo-ACP synthase [Planctomycetota bacterium]|jgi:holo-[acyl-carrier protein] synthase|nr:holo-ACP synthase [Planctomycetia bacterium]MDO7678105.1 holo-ACP synthase [Pirellulales bacterium]RLS31350.1 MAG: holo-[acyl-carrier-protein] synthase [Planctomycetota bacterium]
MSVLGIGTDITECLRIAQMIERHGELFVTRVYTTKEIDYCKSRRMATQHFAGRWAAKEAVLKALGTGWRRGISWRDIEVINGPGGRPHCTLQGGALEAADALGISQVLVSISHCRSHATAMAVAVDHTSSGANPFASM